MLSILVTNSFALKSDGTLWGAGSNIGDYVFQYGTSSNLLTVQYLPQNYSDFVQIGSDIYDIVSASEIVLARKTDGTVWGWGWFNHLWGQLAQNDSIGYSSPVHNRHRNL